MFIILQYQISLQKLTRSIISFFFFFPEARTGGGPGFQGGGGGGALKKLRRVEGGAKIFGVFRVKNHDFTPKKSYFFPILDPPL
jgi:hypothetical protein